MIKMTFKERVAMTLKRYSELYNGKNARIALLDHIIFGYGTGYQFLKDGSLINVYDEPEDKWVERQKYRWEEAKKEWLSRYEEDKSKSYYKHKDIRKEIDDRHNADKWYFDTFNPYADRYEHMREKLFGPEKEVYEIRYDFKSNVSLINNFPPNADKEVVAAAIELLDYMIVTKQHSGWAKKTKKNILNT